MAGGSQHDLILKRALDDQDPNRILLHKASVKSFDIFNAGILGVTGTASVIVSVDRHLVDVFFLSNAFEGGYDSNVLSKLTNSFNCCCAVFVLSQEPERYRIFRNKQREWVRPNIFGEKLTSHEVCS